MVLTVLLAFGQTPSTTTTTIVPGATTTTDEFGAGAFLDGVTGSLQCTADVIQIRCFAVAPKNVVDNLGFEWQWTIDRRVFPDQVTSVLTDSLDATVGRHHIEAVVTLGPHRSSPFVADITIAPPPPVSRPRTLPWTFWVFVGAIAIATVQWIVRKVRAT